MLPLPTPAARAHGLTGACSLRDAAWALAVVLLGWQLVAVSDAPSVLLPGRPVERVALAPTPECTPRAPCPACPERVCPVEEPRIVLVPNPTGCPPVTAAAAEVDKPCPQQSPCALPPSPPPPCAACPSCAACPAPAAAAVSGGGGGGAPVAECTDAEVNATAAMLTEYVRAVNARAGDNNTRRTMTMGAWRNQPCAQRRYPGASPTSLDHVLVLIMGGSVKRERAVALQETWARHFSHTVLMGDVTDDAVGMITLPELAGKADYAAAQQRSLRSLVYGMEHLPQGT
jgi:hypothetical protein